MAINGFGRVASNAVMHASAVTTPRIRSITEIDVSGKTVLVRADLNVPMRSKEVADATRLERILPTIRYLVARKSRVVLLSHLGRPSGRETELSLAPVAGATDGFTYVSTAGGAFLEWLARLCRGSLPLLKAQRPTHL